MPVYNGEPYIREALDSLLAQTFTDFELIISDNASTDNTETICREYATKDPRIRYIRQPENRGAIANFKFVLEQARGEYFMWAAADDVWDSRWIEILLPVASSYRCLAYGSVKQIDRYGKLVGHPANCRKFSYTGSRIYRRLKYFIEPPFLGKANPIYGIYPIEKLRQNDIFITATYGGDMLFLYTLLSETEIRSNCNVYLYKRIHDGFISSTGQEENKASLLKKSLKVIRSILSAHKIGNYLTISEVHERFILFALLPFSILYTIFEECKFKSRKLVKNRRLRSKW